MSEPIPAPTTTALTVDVTPAPPPAPIDASSVPAILSYLKPDELADRTDWVKKLIARRRYLPGEPGKAWAGQNDVIGTAMSEFGGVSEAEASALVGVAVEDLWSGSSLGEAALQVRKQAQFAELEDMARVCEQRQDQTTIEQTYQYVQRTYPDLDQYGNPHPKAGEKMYDESTGLPVMIKLPHRRKELPPDTGNWIRLRLDVLRQQSALLGLDGNSGQGDTSTAMLLEEIDEAGTKKTRIVRSIAQTVKTSDPSQMKERARAEYERVVRESVEQSNGGGQSRATEPPAGKTPAGKSKGHGGPGRKK